jgi:hypothetical protein
MTTTAELRALGVSALAGATNAGNNVFSPLDLPTWSGDYPILFVTTPDEDAESLGRNGAPQFTVTATLRVVARIEQMSLPNDMGAAAAYAALETLRDQIKVAVINYTPLMQQLQQFPYYRTRMDVKAEGEQHLGEVVIDIGLEFYQGPEDFYPIPVVPLKGVDITVEEPDGTTEPGLTINLPQS